MRTSQSSPYDEFEEGQTVYIEETLQDSTDNGATWSAVNLTSATLTVELRAQTFPPGTTAASWLTIGPDNSMTKVTAASGIVGKYVRFTGDYGQVELRIVLIDSAVADTTTTSTYRERTFRKWLATVRPCVRAA